MPKTTEILWNQLFEITQNSSGYADTMILTLTTSPSLTLPLQTGLSSPGKKKQLSQQLWLSGHQRECQEQFLTLGCSWLIFYLFDLELTFFTHILIQVNRLVIEALPLCLWSSLYFVAPFLNRCRVPAEPPLLLSTPKSQSMVEVGVWVEGDKNGYWEMAFKMWLDDTDKNCGFFYLCNFVCQQNERERAK